MRLFAISVDGDEHDGTKRIEFKGDDPRDAFLIMEREGIGKDGILWEGSKRLGRLSRAKAGYWELSS